MIGPIFFVLIGGLLVVLPAIAGWTALRKFGLGLRFLGAIIGGQLIFLPLIGFIAFFQEGIASDPWRLVALYGALAALISIMTLVFLEMRKTHKE